jgi:hypothetical protein
MLMSKMASYIMRTNMSKFKNNDGTVKKRKKLPWFVRLLLWFGISDLIIAAGIILTFKFYVYGAVMIDTDTVDTITIKVNKEGEVTSVYSGSPEGRAAIGTESLLFSDVDTAVSAVMLNLVDMGYITEDNPSALISAYARTDELGEELAEELMYDAAYAASDVMDSNFENSLVLDQTIDNDAWTKGFAARYNIPTGKGAFIMRIVSSNPSLSAGELAAKTYPEILLACYEADSDPYEFIDILGYPEDLLGDDYEDEDYEDYEDNEDYEESEDNWDTEEYEDGEVDESDTEENAVDEYWNNYDNTLEDNEYSEDEEDEVNDASEDDTDFYEDDDVSYPGGATGNTSTSTTRPSRGYTGSDYSNEDDTSDDYDEDDYSDDTTEDTTGDSSDDTWVEPDYSSWFSNTGGN